MDVYSIKKNSINTIELIPFENEREIQDLVEGNTETLFGVEFVSSEFKIEEFRIDSLCFNNETNSFTIIEYKKGSSYSVIDQGYSYLSKMLNNKDSFIVEYNEKLNKSLKRDQIDWSQSTIIFVSPSFNTYQKNSVNFQDIPFELWEIKRFTNNTIVLNQHMSQSNESIKKVVSGKDNIIDSVSKEVIVYTKDEFTKGMNNNLVEILNGLEDRLSDWDDIQFKYKKKYLSIWKNKKVLVYIDKQKDNLRTTIVRGVHFGGKVKELKNLFNLDDPKKMFSKWENKYKKLYRHKITSTKDLDYFVLMVKQKYETK